MRGPQRAFLPLWVGLPAAGVLGGAALQMQQAALWPAPQVRGLGAVALLLLAVAWGLGRRGGQGRPALAALAALAAGSVALAFAVTAERAAARLADALAPDLEGQDLELVGMVAEMPRSGLLGARFIFEVQAATLGGEAVAVPERVSLGWTRGPDDDALVLGPGETLRAGQRWRLPVRLRQPHGAVNPHGFDLELWLFEQPVRAVGQVRSRAGARAVKLDEQAGAAVERWRQAARDAIEQRVADATAAGVLAALALGDQGAIERDDWALFRDTGVAHLMSISGLHVTMFAWLAAGAIGALWRRSERLALALPAPVAGRWGGLLAAAGYALFAGWGVPAQRTVWMIAAVTLLRSAGLRWPLPLVLLVAGAAVVALDPWAVMQAGFWLSFGAVALLAAAGPGAQARAGAPGSSLRSRLAEALREGLRSQAVATVGLTPLSMLFFQQVSVVGFVANLVAIPLVTLAITPLALLGLLLPPLWAAAAWLVNALVAALALLAQGPLVVWSAAAAPPWAVACGLLGGALAVMPLPWRLRWLSLPLMLPLLAPPVLRPAEGRFELLAMDIGQGTAVLVRTRSHLLVYDTGPMFSPQADAGSRLLVPLLRARGERQVDLLVLSHRDSDHVGGAAALLAALPVAALASSLADAHALRADAAARGIGHDRCAAGGAWQWDGVRFELLHPTDADYAAAPKPNALSCVLRVSAGHRSVLLTGDIEAAQEAALLARGAAVASDVLLVPHHGSRTSSTAAFLEAVAPRVALVQAAYRSRFGHPAPDVVARYVQRGIAVVRSDRCGAWTWPAEGAPWCEREVVRRYWHHRVVEEQALPQAGASG